MTIHKIFIQVVLICVFGSYSEAKEVSSVNSKKSVSARTGNKEKSIHIPKGVLLEGKDSSLAINAVKNYEVSGQTADSGILKGPGSGVEYYNNLLAAVLNEKATVGQVNRVLKKNKCRIGYMRSNDENLTLSIPIQKSVQDLENLAGILMSSGAFQIVIPGTLLQPQ